MWNFLRKIGWLSLCFLLLLPSVAFGQEVPNRDDELKTLLIQLEIELLNSKDLLSKQKITLALLKSQLGASEKTIKNLETSITNLEKHILELENTILLLKQELENSQAQTKEVSNLLDEASKSLRNQRLVTAGISTAAILLLASTIYFAFK